MTSYFLYLGIHEAPSDILKCIYPELVFVHVDQRGFKLSLAFPA